MAHRPAAMRLASHCRRPRLQCLFHQHILFERTVVMSAIQKWLYGLFAAVIGAAGGAIPLIIISPLTFNMTGPGLIKLGEACGPSALIALGASLTKSPPPNIQPTTQPTTLETTTTVNPAPDPTPTKV